MKSTIAKFRVYAVKESSHRYDVDKTIHGPEDAAQVARTVLKMDQEAQEVFAVLLLDIKNHVIGVSEITRGTLDASLVHPREVFKTAILCNARSIICLHNHPSGCTTPSGADHAVTKRLVNSGDILDIPVLDHIIIADNDYLSFKEQNEI